MKKAIILMISATVCIAITVILIFLIIAVSIRAPGEKAPAAGYPSISRDTADKAIELFGDDLRIDSFSLNEYTKADEKYTLLWEGSEFEKKYNWYEMRSTINYIDDSDENALCRSHRVNVNIGFSPEARQLLDLGEATLPEGSVRGGSVTDTADINGVEVKFDFSGINSHFPYAQCSFDLNSRTYQVRCEGCCCKEIVLQTARQILS